MNSQADVECEMLAEENQAPRATRCTTKVIKDVTRGNLLEFVVIPAEQPRVKALW